MDAEGEELDSRADEPERGLVREGRGPAILLTAAAVAVAVVGGRASLRSSDATYLWQQAVRQEVKRASAYVEDIRFVYSSETPVALKVTEARLRQEELAKAIPTAPPTVGPLLAVEQRAQSEVAKALSPNVDLLTDPRYRTPDGFDVARRLADARAKNPDLVAIDPDVPESQGDDASDHAIRLVAVTPLIAGAFLCGSLAQGVARRRRRWLLAGTAFLVVGVAAAIAVEVVS